MDPGPQRRGAAMAIPLPDTRSLRCGPTTHRLVKECCEPTTHSSLEWQSGPPLVAADLSVPHAFSDTSRSVAVALARPQVVVCDARFSGKTWALWASPLLRRANQHRAAFADQRTACATRSCQDRHHSPRCAVGPPLSNAKRCAVGKK